VNRLVVRNLVWQLARNRFFGAALLFIAGGVLAGFGSLFSLVRFFRAHMPITRNFTASELLLGIVLPHIGLLFCITTIIYGFFLLRRSDVWRFLVVVGQRP